jgi:prepilin-type N-terminal cleavage/methylation domain-containing protein
MVTQAKASQNKNLVPRVVMKFRAVTFRGYTLVEVVVSIAIIAVLSTTVFGLIRRSDSAKVAATARMATHINNAAMVYRCETGRLPKDQPKGVIPPELRSYFKEDFFGNETPIGGCWDWNGEGDDQNPPGISVAFANQESFSKQLAAMVDKLVDDGDLSGGACFLNFGSVFLSLQFALDSQTVQGLTASPDISVSAEMEVLQDIDATPLSAISDLKPVK